MSSIMPQIEHVIVLMLENRSLDNLLGWLYKDEPPRHSVVVPESESGPPTYDGLQGGEHWNRFSANETKIHDFNHLGDQDCENDTPRGDRQYVQQGTSNDEIPSVDPFEPYLAVNQQLYWPDAECPKYFPSDGQPAGMKGFLANYRRHEDVKSDHQALEILQTYTPEKLTVLNTLARSYAVCDRWFASVPSQTFCNRGFVGAGTSCGQTDNSLTRPFDAETIWNIFERAGIGWRIYFQDGLLGEYCLTRHLFTPLHDVPGDRFRSLSHFYDHLAGGQLPAYSFLEPAWNFSYIRKNLINGNSYHPPAHLAPGERFVRELFDAVSTSPKWEQTLLVITFDEHGGTYDHAPPAPKALAPWDAPGYPCPEKLEHGFEFRRYGVRVPTILISPWIEERTVFRSNKTSADAAEIPFDHTSILATLLEWQGIEKEERQGGRTWGLGARTDAAPKFGAVLDRREPRSDLPVFPPGGYAEVRKARHEAAAHLLTDFQKALFGLVVHEATGGHWPWHDLRNQRLVARMHDKLKTQGDLAEFAAGLRRRHWCRRRFGRRFG